MEKLKTEVPTIVEKFKLEVVSRATIAFEVFGNGPTAILLEFGSDKLVPAENIFETGTLGALDVKNKKLCLDFRH